MEVEVACDEPLFPVVEPDFDLDTAGALSEPWMMFLELTEAVFRVFVRFPEEVASACFKEAFPDPFPATLAVFLSPEPLFPGSGVAVEELDEDAAFPFEATWALVPWTSLPAAKAPREAVGAQLPAAS